MQPDLDHHQLVSRAIFLSLCFMSGVLVTLIATGRAL